MRVGPDWCPQRVSPAGDFLAGNLPCGCACQIKLPWARAGLCSLGWLSMLDNFLDTWDKLCSNFLQVEVLPSPFAVLLPHMPCAKEQGGRQTPLSHLASGTKICQQSKLLLWVICSTLRVVEGTFLRALRLKY